MRFRFVIAAALAVASLSAFAQTPLIEQGRAATQRGDYDAAVELLEKAVKQSPNSAEAHYYLGGAYGNKAQASSMFGAARLASKAKEALERAVALNPKYVEARLGLVDFYTVAPGFMGGSFDKAFEQAKAIKALDPLMGHRAYSSIYTRQKKADLAKKEYLDAIREQPNSPRAHSWYGQYLANVEKNYTAAFAEFDTVLKLDPTYMAAWYHIGRTAALANASLPRGEEALRKYLGHTPKENEPTIANAHYWLGAIYEKQGRKAEAKASYQTALKLNPALKQASEALKRVS